MAREKLSEQEWEMFLGLGDRLGINLRTLLKEDARFYDLENWPVTRWGERWLRPRRSGWRSPGRNVSGDRSLARAAGGFVRWCIGIGDWRP